MGARSAEAAPCPAGGHHNMHKLRIAPCFALLQSYRYEDFARSRFILIPVAFEIASSLLHTLRA